MKILFIIIILFVGGCTGMQRPMTATERRQSEAILNSYQNWHNNWQRSMDMQQLRGSIDRLGW